MDYDPDIDVEPFFQWESPNGPDMPFVTGILLFDIIRIVIILVCVGIGALSMVAAIRPAGTLGHRARLIGAGVIFVITVATGQYSHIGDFGHWRMIVSFIASVIYAWGLWSYYAYEKPAEVKPLAEQG